MNNQFSSQLLRPLDRYIPHPQAEFVLNELEFVMQHQRDTGEALGIRVTGPTNAGKTTVMKELCRRYPPIFEPTLTRHPVLYVHLPERAKLIDVYISVLRAMDDPASAIGTQRDLRYRSIDMLAKTKVELIIFDEPHHLTDARSEGARLGLTQLAKTLIDQGLSVVFAGVKSVDDLVMESDELARRFRVKYTLGAYKISNQQDLLALKRYCDALGGQLQYVEPVKFGKDDVWFSRLLAISQGLVGTITQLVNQAESRAKHKGDRSLTMRHFFEAWSNFASSDEEGLQHLGKKSRTRLINVFEVDDDEVLNMLGKLV